MTVQSTVVLYNMSEKRVAIPTVDTVVLGHGRLHQKIHGIDYDTTLFIDIDPKCQPDMVLDLKRVRFDPSCNVNSVIIANCAASIMINYSPVGHQTISDVFLQNVWGILRPGGKLYTTTNPLYSDTRDRERKFINSVGLYFTYCGRVTIPFGISLRENNAMAFTVLK